MKSQAVRLVDVLVLGPFMMWAAGQRSLSPTAQLAMFVSGALTIAYNAENYLAYKKPPE